MHFDRVLTEFRESLARLAEEIRLSIQSNQMNIAHLSEPLFCELLNVLYGWRLRDLNVNVNHPAIDLADDDARVAVQITATAESKKVKDTVTKFLEHNLHERFDRLIIFVTTRRLDSYQQKSIDDIVHSRMKFDVRSDIWDYRDLATCATRTKPARVHVALSHLNSYLRDQAEVLAEEDTNPPVSPPEKLTVNLIPIRLPDTLYVADVIPDVGTSRQSVREWAHLQNIRLPSDYEISRKQILTFRKLDGGTPFKGIFDEGTVTPLDPQEYYGQDASQERIFKSLLRFLLQQQLFAQDVRWSHESHMFFFAPRSYADNRRAEIWRGHRMSTRVVFERKMKREKPTEVLVNKHLAFSVSFIVISGAWYALVRPDWYFSYGEQFGKSKFADEQLANIKRKEREHSVRNSFRFIATWLSTLSDPDFFSHPMPHMEFGDSVSLTGGRALDEGLWASLRDDDAKPGSSSQDDLLSTRT